MTSQNSENKTLTSTTVINNNFKVGQSILMKECKRNQISNNNILLLNRTVIEPKCNVKNSGLLQFPPAASNLFSKSSLSKLLQSQGQKFYNSNAEIIGECDDNNQDLNSENDNKKNSNSNDFVKNDTPLLQIFDGSLVISQELSLEEVQNLIFQINSKFHSQSQLVSTNFSNASFSTDVNQEIEIIAEEKSFGNEKRSQSIFSQNSDLARKTTKGIGHSVATSDQKIILKPHSVGDKVENTLNHPSTSTETNFLITFKRIKGQKQPIGNGFEGDYSNVSRLSLGDKSQQKDHIVDRVILDNASAELMQIEVVEDSGEPLTASGISTVNTLFEKDGEPLKLPDNLESVPRAEYFPTQRHRWNTNEEIAAILINFDKHNEWQSKEVIIRPKSGSMLLYSRKKVRYRRDGYCWKKRKDGKTTREDHMKLKVQGAECIYGCYVHSAILPTFHRRCYWLLQNPDIVLVHYLNVPYPDDNKLAVLAPSLAQWGDKKEWTKEELISQLKPMFYSVQERDINNELEISTAETVEVIVTQLMEKQRVARAATLTKQLECGCPDSTCADGKTCSHPMRRITAANHKQESNSRTGQCDNSNQVSSTTGSGILLNKASTTVTKNAIIDHRTNTSEKTSLETQSQPSSLVLSLSQIHSGGSLALSQIQDGTNLLILNNLSSNENSNHPTTSASAVNSFKCPTNSANVSQIPQLKQYHHPRNKVVPKHDSVDGNQSSCCRITNDPVVNTTAAESNCSQTNVNPRSILFTNQIFENGKCEEEKDSKPTPSVSPSRRTTDCNNSGDTILVLNTINVNRANALSSIAPGSSFYNETLDLSQEDIQRTLSANMPLTNFTSHRENTHRKSPPNNVVLPADVLAPEINPMELMDSPPPAVDDDVFVNLDAFDMLSDFPELEILDSGSNSRTTSGLIVSDYAEGCGEQSSGVGGQFSDRVRNAVVKDESVLLNIQRDFREVSSSITDFSPEWAYPEGGVKVLVTGPWYSSTSQYTVLFDSFPVPTTLVQSGVLRCFCPAHEVGLATVQVACEGLIISNSVMFEYKRPPHGHSIKLKEPKLEDNENFLKFTLLQRLEAVDGRLHIKEEPGVGDLTDAIGIYHQSPNFEERLVSYCQDMTNRRWRTKDSITKWTLGLRGMTLLHLAASLGYARLVCTMLHWRAENSSLLLETEIDALSQDDEGFTPLMWACGRGHRETALVLYRWNHAALYIHNSMHQSALSYARAKGQTDLAKEIENLEITREEANMTFLSRTFNSSNRSSESDVTPNESPTSSLISLNSLKSHDGIFLRPDRIVKCESRFKTFFVESGSNFSDRNESLSLTTGINDTSEKQYLIKRSSVDSGINLGSHKSDSFSFLPFQGKFKSGAGGCAENPKLSRFDRSMSLPLHVSYGSFEPDRHGMDFALCEVTAVGPNSKSSAKATDNFSEDETDSSADRVGQQEVKFLTLAEQIIAAIPQRIKNETENMQLDNTSSNDTLLSKEVLCDSLIEAFLENPPACHPPEFNFEFSDHNYRYHDMGTPSSSLSPASSTLQSPSPGFPIHSPSPPPTTQDFCEFFEASGSIFERDFSNLTLSDREQRELYQAAKIIQKAYRSYKGRKKLAEDKERAAAILIQNYYRRYKQYAYFKQMTHAAMVIQNGYRSYCEQKKFKKSQEASAPLQNYYRHYKGQGESKRMSKENISSTGSKRCYSKRRQYQAACKIQQFMRLSKNKLQKERILAAEKERPDVRQYSQDAPPKSQSLDNSPLNDRCLKSGLEGNKI